MADWPPVAPVRPTLSPQERESTYLMLVDMFVDIVEPEIIQMVLQNRNWDVDAALEDIMMMTNTSQPSSTQNVNKTLNASNQTKTKRNTSVALQEKNVPFDKLKSFQPYNLGKMSAYPQDSPQSKPRKQTPEKPFHNKTSETKKLNQLQLQPFIEQYNFIKTTRSPFDRAVMLVKDGVKVMIILRGPPGSGKSSLAKRLLLESGIEPPTHKRHIFSTDDFFVRNRVYMFVPELLSQAHSTNQRNVAAAIREEVSPVIVDNTNTQAWEMRAYADMAVSAGYDLEILEPDTWWFRKGSASELEKRNIHSVSKAKIRQMLERYEKNITPDSLIRQFELKYPLLKMPPQPTRNCKWRDKLSNQRNNKPKKKKIDFSPQPQNFENINTMFQSIHLNSPGFSQFGNDFAVQQSSFPNFSFPPPVNTTEAVKEGSTIFSNGVATKKVAQVSSSTKNGDSSKGLSLDESDTNTLFNDLVTNSNGFLKSLSGFSNTSHDSVKPPQQTNGTFPSNIFHQGKDNFDLMAETKKLLEALNRPTSSPLKQSQGQVVSETEKYDEHPKGNEKETFMPHSQHTESCAAYDFVEKSNSSSQENINVAQGLIESIIDKAVGLDDEKTFNLSSSITNSDMVDQAEEEGFMWDYVVVNYDETFTYQRTNSIPIGLPVTIKHNLGSSNVTSEINSAIEYQGHNVNINSEEVYESDGTTIENYSCDIAFSSNQKDPTFSNCLNDTPGDSNIFQSELAKQLGLNIHSDIPDNNENLDSEPAKIYLKEMESEKTENTRVNDNPNLLEVMKDMICTSSTTTVNSCNYDSTTLSSLGDTKSQNISESNVIPATIENPFISASCDPLVDWEPKENAGSNEINVNEKAQPKPARNLRRPKLLINAADHQFVENDFSKYFGNWNTVSNPADTWVSEKPVDDCSNLNNEGSPLPQRFSPQRCKIYKEVVDSSTNTNYLDFNLVNEDNVGGVKILIGNINNFFCENVPNVKQSMAETLFLDKSTMTIEESLAPLCSYDTTQIEHLFPKIPQKYILDVVKKCQGDMDWAVDVLLDSEHNIAPMSIESDDSDSSNDEVECVETPCENYQIKSPKQEPKIPFSELTELKKQLESSVVFDRSHYSDKVLKVVKRKHPEYVQLIEKSPAHDEMIVDRPETADGSQNGCKTEDEVDEVEEESSSSGCEVETEDDTMDLVMNNDLILQLQQKFGSSSLPKIADMTPIVKLPVKLARELFGYIMDSLQSDMDQQQSLIEDMIAKDEEVARFLQSQDQSSKPQLREVMDMEIALAMQRADQEELNHTTNEDTLAAKLSKNILLEKFPQVDPRMLKDVLKAHNYSLSETITSLTLTLGVEPATTSQEQPKQQQEDKERVTSIIVSDEAGAASDSAANLATEAAAHRAQAASYYGLRIDCLNKAHEAFRSGNKTVATYYSQLAQIHKERMDQSNSKAAACLFSSHKSGANTLDLHFLHIKEAEVVLDMFLDEVVTYVTERNKRHQTVFLITGRGLRSVGGVSRIKPMVQRKLQYRGIRYSEVNPGMLSAIVRNVTPLSYTL
ncbi:uncharacterized protein LOC128991586 [Macrosteles quadrilineatus]|uniref:uncharacterized protein LOC128991586 n=1 Tax=Macrosteles quadrilineatus TaxID=74068 RepID=UPI0023E15C7B|nr:uncharacterized protein LOC128991586 [Macrosteles quadrilineatus]